MAGFCPALPRYRLASLVAASAKTVHRTVFFRKLRLLPPCSNPAQKNNPHLLKQRWLFWLRWRDSNPRMQQSKCCVLPLDDTSIFFYKHKSARKGSCRFVLGWIVGFEPTVSSATNWRFNQLSYTHHMARLKGLEPLTHCLEGSCSIHLSYKRKCVLIAD